MPQEPAMTRRDQELLDRQLRAMCAPRRRDGIIMLTIASLFAGGLFLGNLHGPKATVSGLQSEIAITAESAAAVSQ
jgi:hypothetical protein